MYNHFSKVLISNVWVFIDYNMLILLFNVNLYIFRHYKKVKSFYFIQSYHYLLHHPLLNLDLSPYLSPLGSGYYSLAASSQHPQFLTRKCGHHRDFVFFITLYSDISEDYQPYKDLQLGNHFLNGLSLCTLDTQRSNLNKSLLYEIRNRNAQPCQNGTHKMANLINRHIFIFVPFDVLLFEHVQTTQRGI